MNYFIRKLEKSDIKPLSKIMMDAFLNEPWNETWNERMCIDRLTIFINISTSLSYTLVNEKNEICGAAIGYVIPFVNKMEYDLQEFFIDPKLTKNHLGSFLMDELLKKVRKTNVDTFKFYTSGNLYKFYSKFGFKKIEDEYLMNMNIN